MGEQGSEAANVVNFDTAYEQLTGNAPFPWQRDLYENWFSQGKFPDACVLPTGLGKTSVIAVWLIALANRKLVPHRLVYVVNRRTVVDQTTDEVEKYRKNLATAGITEPLKISTLRGQHADNREWSADPSRPAVICGTVDMIGSRLLFSGYGCGFKTRPLHAGFLGQDALLVHDEAHLEPAFQELILNIQREQHDRERADGVTWPKLRVMELTATSRSGGKVFPDAEEQARNETDPVVQRRIGAKKKIEFYRVDDEKAALVKKIVARAKARGGGNAAVVVFVRSVERAGEITNQLEKTFPNRVEQLNGTLRGYERDGLVEKPVFRRFLPQASRDAEEPAFLVCTSAGEVGVNISADHLVCDLSTFDSMAQRLGRVNRFGEPADHVAYIDIVHPEFDKDEKLDDIDRRRKRTLDLLRMLNGDGSPAALREIHRKAMREGSGTGPMFTDRTEALRKYILSTYAPQPTTLPTSDILFDVWALTTISGKLPGRPAVEPYLHGIEDDKQRETHVAWRTEVKQFASATVTEDQITELLDEFPLRPHELLRDATYRVQDELAELATGQENRPVWVIDADDAVHIVTLGKLAEKEKKGYALNLSGRTVVLPPSAGGLTKTGMLSGSAPHDPGRKYDVAGLIALPSGSPLIRLLVTPSEEETTYRLLAPVGDLPDEFSFELGASTEREKLRKAFPQALPPMRVAFRLDLPKPEAEEDRCPKYLVLKPESRQKIARHEAAWPALDTHNNGVGEIADELCKRLNLPAKIRRAVSLAAGWHDLGKGRQVWQLGAGNKPTCKPVAKPIHGRPPENLNHFRHELGSVIDTSGDPALAAKLNELADEQDDWARELTLHLIAAHHGRARPHFSAAEATDPERLADASESVAADTPGRFARLQRRFGRWGLAYLESLIRAADALDSRRIEDTPLGEEEPGQWPAVANGFAWPVKRPTPEPTIRVVVDPTNPGQFFACCGLLELADRLWAGAEGWFADGGTTFHLYPRPGPSDLAPARLIRALARSRLTNTMTLEQVARLEHLDRMKAKERARMPGLNDEKKALEKLWRASPLLLHEPFDIRLDWYLDDRAGGARFKTWAGQQCVIDIACAMKRPIENGLCEDVAPSHWLDQTTEDEGLPFNFDSDLASQSSAIDLGFSLDPLGMSPRSRPLLELAAFVGLQRFRPVEGGENRYTYFLWENPLPPELASVAAAGVLDGSVWQAFVFPLLYRTKYLKSFLPARPIGGAR